MSLADRGAVRVFECMPEAELMAAEVLAGLRRRRKTLPAKYFYDAAGSGLFEQICELTEYYPTRSELSIMDQHASEMAEAIGPCAALLELGSGSSQKTPLLLEHLERPAVYVPIDISRSQLAASAAALTVAYPQVPVLPVWADYTKHFRLPAVAAAAARRVVYFPGSTIGNFGPRAARRFLARLHQLAGPAGALLIGVDLRKGPEALHAAYNDQSGVTAAFNRNVLRRLNDELAATFHLDRFAHYAFYNPRRGAIEMHLVSLCDQRAYIAGELFHFDEGESIHTECSYKYTLDGFESLAIAGGWHVDRVWIDSDRQFSVQYLTCG